MLIRIVKLFIIIYKTYKQLLQLTIIAAIANVQIT